MRYAAESGLRQIDVGSFTVLVERVNIRSLRRFHERGVPGAILTKSQEMPLPEPFWLHYHASIRNSDHSLSKLYSIAYVYKNQLDKYFAPSFVKRLEALSTWGGDKTTSCIRAHFLREGVNFEVDLGGLNLEPRPLDVLHDSIASSDGVHVETRKVIQLTVHVPSDLGKAMVDDMSFPHIRQT